jgi:glucose/arabinose dehydrogenase
MRRQARTDGVIATRRPRRAVTLAVLLALAILFGVSCSDPRVVVEPAVSNLDHPWDVGFLPDGTMLVTERPGRLSRVVDGVARLIVAPADVLANGEGGMLGLAVDPLFRATGNVFVCMVSSIATPPDVRIVRFTLSPDGATVLSRTDIFTGLPLTSGRHSGCRPRFGPDNYLWVGTGDAATGVHPQDPLSWGGKVLRLRRNGTPAAGNPFGLPWYTRGHRNVQGLAFRPDGLAVSVEQGTNCDDEVNVLRLGGNYGWDPVPGYNESRPMTDLVKFPEAHTALWSSGCPTIATSGATFVRGRQWGTWDGALIIGVLKGRHLHVLIIDKEHRLVRERRILEGTYGRLRQPVQGPDGNLYVTTDNGGGNDVILKVTPRTART